MHALSLLPLVTGFMLTAAIGPPPECEGAAPPRDHYDPAALVEFAREREYEGDVDTARIMRARAKRISPNDARTAGASVPVQAAAPGPAPVPLPAPPPIWPAKPAAP